MYNKYICLVVEKMLSLLRKATLAHVKCLLASSLRHYFFFYAKWRRHGGETVPRRISHVMHNLLPIYLSAECVSEKVVHGNNPFS